MKKTVIIFLFLSQTIANAQVSKLGNDEFNTTIKKWFNAWELVSKQVFGLTTLKPTEFVFFDETFVYTNSTITCNGGDSIIGQTFFGNNYLWLKKKHNGKITLPDGQERTVGIMAFSYPFYNNPKFNAFFVMPLPSYWKLKNVDDHGIGIELLTTGVFVHEFCHSQQFEKGLNGMEDTAFEIYFTAHENEVFMDDIMQDIYKKDSVYIKEFNSELAIFTSAAACKTLPETKLVVKKAFLEMKKRQQRILKEDKRDLAEIDNYWLTIEGVAQYSSYQWLIHSKGGNLKKENALKALKTTSWSQEEGFAIVNTYAKFVNPKLWATKMFRTKKVNIVEMLQKQIEGVK
jgi:hypothetical protein